MAQIPAGTNRSRQLTTKQTGDDAELRARRWLENQGLYFVAANVRERCGEIDLIMRDGAVTVFVEVRFRASKAYGGAAASVTRNNRNYYRLPACARHNGSFDTVDCRFDVIAFTGNEIEWFQNAFS